MKCFITNNPLSKEDQQMYFHVLDTLGLGKKRYYRDPESNELIQIIPFARNLRQKFQKHVPLCAQAIRSPPIEGFKDVLQFIKNIRLSQIVRLGRGIAQNPNMRSKLHYPYFEDFVKQKYNELSWEADAILAQFNNCCNFQQYLDVIERLLVFRYQTSNHGFVIELHPLDRNKKEFPDPDFVHEHVPTPKSSSTQEGEDEEIWED